VDPEINPRHRRAGIGASLGSGKAARQCLEAHGIEVVEQGIRPAGGDAFVRAKETADIDPVSFDSGAAHISVVAKVDLQISIDFHSPKM